MKKLTTLVTMMTLATTLAVAGCKKGKGDEAADKAAKPADTGSAAGSAAPAGGSAAAGSAAPAAGSAAPAGGSAAAGSAAPAAGGGGGDLPQECQDYKAAIDKLASCDKLPQASRDALKSAYDQASTAWGSLPPEAKASLAQGCKAGADAVKQSASICN